MKKNIVIVLLVIAVLGMGGFIVYDKVLNKDDSKEVKKDNSTQKEPDANKISKIDETKGYYYYEITEELGEILGGRDESGFGTTYEFEQWYEVNKDNKTENSIGFFENDFVVKNKKIRMKYPVINIDTTDVKNVNSKIMELVNQNKLDNVPLNINGEGFCIAIKVNGDDTIKTLYQIVWNEYKIYETDTYISLFIYEDGIAPCSGFQGEILASYVIDKTTGKELTKTEILEKYNLDVNGLNKKVKQAYIDAQDEEYQKELENDETFSLGVEEGNYELYIDNDGNLNFVSQNMTPSMGYFELKNNVWKYVNVN